MERLLTLALAGCLSVLNLNAQTMDIVVFSDMGDKFTLMVDGADVNAVPASRVVASGIRNETPSLLIRFADASKTPIKQAGYFPPRQRVHRGDHYQQERPDGAAPFG